MTATSRGVQAFLHGTAAHGEQRPFGQYRVSRLADGRAVGGVGFKGQPEGGCVAIGCGLSESARCHGYAAEAVAAVLTIAADYGLSKVVADTTLDNIASQRTLIRAGFRLISADDESTTTRHSSAVGHRRELISPTRPRRTAPSDKRCRPRGMKVRPSRRPALRYEGPSCNWNGVRNAHSPRAERIRLVTSERFLEAAIG